MKQTTQTLLTTLAVTVSCLALPAVMQAAGDLSRQTPVELTVELGNKEGAQRFYPDHITLETGKLYRLILTNPSPEKHYFSSDKLAQAVFSRKVQVNGPDGKAVAEIKGFIREIEVYPNGTAEWWFVPVKAGTFNDLQCTIKGHTEQGMVGAITIR